jgi:mannose-6-phosphate isomerase-like protein (cupin superfamily)
MTDLDNLAPFYERWIREQGVPVVEGYGVDVTDIPVGDWARKGGRGAFVQLRGMEGATGMEVVEIPARQALEPERHLYEKVFYVISGLGSTEVWQKGQPKRFFEWGAGSLFATPLNASYRLINGGTQPARLAAVTNAPMIMDMFHNNDFIFNCDYQFTDRYNGEENYFEASNKRYVVGRGNYWDTNFIADVSTAAIDAHEYKGKGGSFTGFEIAGNSLVGHLVEWPVGMYHKAHYHGSGAVLLILRSEGYTIMWPNELGTHPYATGHGDQVIRVDWKPGTAFGPPSGWFHQHFNLGTAPARQLALRYGSKRHKMGFYVAAQKRDGGVFISVKEGGTLIEYEDEDPEIRRIFEAEIKKRGIPNKMPPVKEGKS